MNISTTSKRATRHFAFDVKGSSVQSELTQLETLRSMSTVSADTGEIDLVQKYGTSDCTTNPTLILKMVQQPQYEHFLKQAIEEAAADPVPVTNHRPYSAISDHLSVLIGCELLRIIPGKISTQVDPHFSYDIPTTVAKAKRLISLYKKKGIEADRVYIKIAATWEGIRACEILKEQGIECNMTILFSFAQAVACGLAGAAMVAAYVGRIMEWYKAKTGREYTAVEDPGVKSVQRIYQYYKTHGVKTLVMAASFRNIGEIQQLAGCDQLTISPMLLEELKQTNEVLPRVLYPDMAASKDAEMVQMDEKLFRELHESDQMASEKLKEGIENFSKDQRTLEDMIGKLVK
eukprot:g542.t1